MAKAGDRSLGEIWIFEAAGIEGGCPGQCSTAVAGHLLGGAKALVEIERLTTARRADDDVQTSPVRLLDRGQKCRRIAVDVNVGVDPREVRSRSGVAAPASITGGINPRNSLRVRIAPPFDSCRGSARIDTVEQLACKPRTYQR